MASSADELEEIRTEVLGDCRRCDLHETRRSLVWASGNPEARIMLVGEAPGENEDKTGIPFCGRAGKLLDTWLNEELGLSRQDVYVANCLKCRPPSNRTPLTLELVACARFIRAQIMAVQPAVLIAVGRVAAQTLLDNPTFGITQARGTWQTYRPLDIPLMPTYHPAFVLRVPENDELVRKDLRRVKRFVGRSGSHRVS